MKKKIYFIISALLVIICAITVFFALEEIATASIENTKEIYSNMPDNLQEQLMENVGTVESTEKSIIFNTLTVIIINIIILIIALKNKILPHKGLLIVLSVLIFFCGVNDIMTLFAFINIIVLICSKRKNPEDFPEKNEIPKLERLEPTQSERICGILLLIIYILNFMVGFIMPEDFPPILGIVISIIINLSEFILAIFSFKSELKRGIKLFKENTGTYIKYIAKRYIVAIIIMFIANILVALLTQKMRSENQTAINNMPILVQIIFAIIYAPVVEEVIFRGVIRRFIKNNKLFIVVSAIVFGLPHALLETTLFALVLTTIPYAILGAFFAYLYVKTENITCNISAHAFQNTLAIVLQNFFI